MSAMIHLVTSNGRIVDNRSVSQSRKTSAPRTSALERKVRRLLVAQPTAAMVVEKVVDDLLKD